ncbi:SAM-dependent methyltransferase, partial [Bacillus cereus group sp. Bce025]
GDLIFLLKHTPIIPNFGEEEEDFNILQKFIKANSSEKGIRTNSKRFMIIAVKS